MGKNSIRIALALFVTLTLVGAWFGVLYSEEVHRLKQVTDAQDSYMKRLRETDRDRKAYFESVAENRKKQAEAMEAARIQYEELLKSQDARVKEQTKTITQYVEKPVTKTETVEVSKPTATRSTKTS